MVEQIKIGVVGLGNMGMTYAKALLAGRIPSAVLTAVCVNGAVKAEKARAEFGDNVQCFGDFQEFISSDEIEAVIIATPNQTHAPMATIAFQAGKHVLLEKPVSLDIREGYDLVALAESQGLTFAVMHHLRFNPQFQKLKALLETQIIGQIQRIHWDNLRYFRPQSYYNSLSWTGTWEKDGGGLLINQAIHELDLLNFLFGEPKSLLAYTQFGAYRNVEVDTESTLILTYPNGASTTFVTSINEPLGQENLRIVGELGEIKWLGDGKITVTKLNQASVQAGTPEISETYDIAIRLDDNSWQADLIASIANFSQHILDDKQPLIAPGLAGVKSVELAKTAWASAYLGQWLQFPVKPAEIEDSYDQIKQAYGK
ncbi:Gfo/Idh/MocA family oxidoreductase [Pseudolactococcus yaeyamensis]